MSDNYNNWDNMEYNEQTGEFEPKKEATEDKEEVKPIVKDSLGIVLKDGDQVKVIKDLKVKGMSKTLKRGVDNYKIKLIAGNTTGVDCKIGKKYFRTTGRFFTKNLNLFFYIKKYAQTF